MKRRRYYSYVRFNAMRTWPDSSHMSQGHDQPDRSVAAHPQITHVVKIDHSRHTRLIHRLDQQRPDNDIRSPRFIDDRPPPAIIFSPKSLSSFRQRSTSQGWPSFSHDSRRLATGMGINYADRLLSRNGHRNPHTLSEKWRRVVCCHLAARLSSQVAIFRERSIPFGHHSKFCGAMPLSAMPSPDAPAVVAGYPMPRAARAIPPPP